MHLFSFLLHFTCLMRIENAEVKQKSTRHYRNIVTPFCLAEFNKKFILRCDIPKLQLDRAYISYFLNNNQIQVFILSYFNPGLEYLYFTTKLTASFSFPFGMPVPHTSNRANQLTIIYVEISEMYNKTKSKLRVSFILFMCTENCILQAHN